MKYDLIIEQIVNWLGEYSKKSKTKGFVVGISGGVDSALTSTLCAKTGLPTLCLDMPISQSNTEISRAENHINWLKSNFKNVVESRASFSIVNTKSERHKFSTWAFNDS